VNGFQNPCKSCGAKKVGTFFAEDSAAPCRRSLGGKQWRRGSVCQGRKPPEAVAVAWDGLAVRDRGNSNGSPGNGSTTRDCFLPFGEAAFLDLEPVFFVPEELVFFDLDAVFAMDVFLRLL
jgi:hypothetical protein